MRFTKESRVEVFSLKNAPPYGAWRSAYILSGNGHMYDVRYITFRFSSNEILEERVARKRLRPCPPLVDVDRWEAGELAEVWDHTCWVNATVLEVLCGRDYVVQLFGTTTKLTVQKNSLRARQVWQGKRWVVTGKLSCFEKSSVLNRNLEPRKTNVVSLKILKRRSPCDWFEPAESCTGAPKKIRSIEKIRVQGSIHNNRSGFRPMAQMARIRVRRFSKCVGAERAVSNASSVGSCDENDMPNCFLDSSRHDSDACRSDADSSKELFGCREEVVKPFRTELYTYRRTLWESFASGSINWDQEAVLTDLRRSLNISNHEHMMELKYLKSSGFMSKFC